MKQWNLEEDRNLKREMVLEQLAAKRQENLLGLMAARQKRQGVEKDETGALMALKDRFRDEEGNISPAHKEYLRSVANAGAASKIMRGIQDAEMDSEGKELYLRGDAISDNFRVFFRDGSPDVKLPSMKEIETSAKDPQAYMDMALRLQQGASSSEAFVDVNPKAVFAGSNKLRTEAQEVFDQILVERFSSIVDSNPDQPNTELVKDLNDLQSDSKTAQARARRKLMISPEGVEAFNEMMEVSGSVPSLGVLNQMPGAFGELHNIWRVVMGWGNVSPEGQAKALQHYPWIEQLVN